MGDANGAVTRRSRLRGLPLLAMILSTPALGLVAGYVIRAATDR